MAELISLNISTMDAATVGVEMIRHSARKSCLSETDDAHIRTFAAPHSCESLLYAGMAELADAHA
ncbi:MAG: hypothetical protein IKJ80_05070 [Clostridia bacterium]|nr:hypothetical protein [Clostridia bacterium]